MIRVLALLFALFSGTLLMGQTKAKTAPFIIKGQILNCPEKQLHLFFQDENETLLVDTITLDGKGNFYLKTFKLQKPQKARIRNNKIGIDNLLIAPGYDLTITGDGKDHMSLFTTKKITGTGAASNRYQFILDSIIIARKDTIKWYELNKADLLTYINSTQQLKDSVARIVFNNVTAPDRFHKYFGSMIQMNTLFNKLYMLLLHVNWNRYTIEESLSFIRQNYDTSVLDNFYKDDYLLSDYYKDWIIADEWLDYLVNLDYKKDTTLRQQPNYKLQKISEAYKGKAKEYASYKLMATAIDYSKSLVELNEVKVQTETYITNLNNKAYKKALEEKLEEKATAFQRTQVGKPAPPFSLQSDSGTIYSLKDFKGKVVYLDLWASWCGPCREETPSLKTLYDKYKKDDRIAFISIAVHDGVNEWKKALEEDKPDWLQLYDKENSVWKAYVANWIPKFIVIDKQGNIVDFNAPRPSSTKELEKLLHQEMEK